MMRLCKTLSQTALASLLLLGGTSSVQAERVDLLIVYDTYTYNYFRSQPDTAIRNWVSQVNTMYQNSSIDIQLRLVGTLKRDIAGTTMEQVLPRLRTDTTVAAKRSALGADYVSMLSKTGNCGLGYFAINRNYTHSVVGPKCGPMTLAHELGHTMGLAHSRRQGDTTGVRYAYGMGHGVDGVFASIMSYAYLFGVNRSARFSNPDLECNGAPCGVAEGESAQADAATAINNIKAEIGLFSPTRVWSGLPVTADASTDEAVSLVTNAVYTFKAKHSNRCLTVSGASTAANAPTVQWSCSNANHQRWQALPAGTGNYRFRAKHSNRCLEVYTRSTDSGKRLVQATCALTPAQYWSPIKNDDGTVTLINAASGMSMDVNGLSTVNGAAVSQFTSDTSRNSQHWALNRLQ